MSKKSLRPNLNQIRTWAQQGRTDAWIAHQLETSVEELQTFKRENGLEAPKATSEAATGTPAAPAEEVDLRAQDDALVAAQLEAEEKAAAEAEAKAKEEALKAALDSVNNFEGTFDQGEEGYGLWLDPAIQDNPIYAEYWAGARNIKVTLTQNEITITRA